MKSPGCSIMDIKDTLTITSFSMIMIPTMISSQVDVIDLYDYSAKSKISNTIVPLLINTIDAIIKPNNILYPYNPFISSTPSAFFQIGIIITSCASITLIQII